MVMTVASGVSALDEMLGGLLHGDNVVWVGDRKPAYVAFERAFLDRSAEEHPTFVVAVSRTELRRQVPPGVEWIDATRSSRLARAGPLADELERLLRQHPSACLVIDGFAGLVRRWGEEEALRFFPRACPAMLQAGAVTYWRVDRSVGVRVLERMRQVTQCMFELRDGGLHVVKAEGRTSLIEGTVHRVELDGDEVTIGPSAAGRLARGLTAVRRDLGLTQAQLADAAGVTPSAISQAESGSRGLSLETLIGLSDRLGVTLDRLANAVPSSGYRLARHDRRHTLQPGDVAALADDPVVGLRAYLVRLGPGEQGAPPFAPKGTELVALANGLVQVSVGDDTPVLRAGDSLLATTAPITGWRNLRPEPASFYWILRD